MEPFYHTMVQALPWLRTRLAYGFMLLVVLSFVFVQTRPNTPVMPQIFIFAVVPLLIAMVLIGKDLPAAYQFVLILTITIMCLAFLGTGVALASGDKTARYETDYESNVYPVEVRLNQRYLGDLKDKIAHVENYAQYRDLILGVAATDNSDDYKSGIEAIVNFYQGYIACRSEFQCFGSLQFDSRIRDFWYTFRPIIEERRVGLWDPDFGITLQRYAEAVRHPSYLSGVKVDDLTGGTSLINTALQKTWTDRLNEFVQRWIYRTSTKAA